MTTIIDMKTEVDTTDIDKAEASVDSLAGTMKKAAASSALYSRRLSEEYSLSASKIGQVSKAVARMHTQEAAQEKAKSRMIMSASAGVRKMRGADAAAAVKAAKATVQAGNSADKAMRTEYNRMLTLQKARETAANAANRQAAAQVAASKRADAAEDSLFRAQYKRMQAIQKAREQDARAAATAAAKAASAATKASNAEGSRVSSMLKQQEIQRKAFERARRIEANAPNVEVSELARNLASTRRLRKELDLLSGSTDKTSRSFGGLMNTLSGMRGTMLSLSGIITGLGVVALYNSLNKYTELTNILKVLGYEGAQAGERLRDIQDVARSTRSPLDELAKIYQKTTMASKELGASQEQALQFTKNVGLALAQQGGATAATKGALLQLSQAIGMGNVKAEEFNSLLEGGYPILVAVARGIDETGGSVMKLRKMMLDQRLTSKIFFDALLSQSGMLESQFGRTVPTLSQAVQVFGDTLMVSAGEMDHALGFSARLSKGLMNLSESMTNLSRFTTANADSIKGLAEWFNTLAIAAVSIATQVLGAKLISALGLSSGAFITLAGAINIATAALKRFAPALILMALYDAYAGYKQLTKGIADYTAAMKDADAAVIAYNASLAQTRGLSIKDDNASNAYAGMLIAGQGLLENLTKQQEALEAQLDGMNFIQKLKNPSLVESIEKETAHLAIQIAQVKSTTDAAAFSMKRLAQEAAGVTTSLDNVDPKVAAAAMSLLKGAKEQIALSEATIKYGKESAEVAAVTRDIEVSKIDALLAEKGIVLELGAQTKAMLLTAYDTKIAQEEINKTAEAWRDIVNGVSEAFSDRLEKYKDEQKSIAEISDERENEAKLAKLSMQYGEDNIRVVQERQRQEMISLSNQLQTLNATAQQRAQILGSANAANTLANAFGMVTGQIGGASSAMAGLLSKILSALGAFRGLLGGMSAVMSAVPNFGPAGQVGGLAGMGLGAIGNVLKGVLPSAGEIDVAMAKVQEGYNGAVSAAEDLKKESEKAGKAGKEGGEKSAKAQKDLLAELYKELDYRKSLIGLSDDQIEQKRIEKEVTDKLTDSEQKYTQEQIQSAIQRTKDVSDMEKAWERQKGMIDEVATAFGDFVMTGFTEFSDFMTSIADLFKQTLSKMISDAVRNPIQVAINMVTGGADPLTQGLNGAGLNAGSPTGGIGGIMGGFGKGLSSFTTGFGEAFKSGSGILGSAGAGIGNVFSTFTSGISSGTLAGLSSALGAAGLIVAGVAAVIKIGKALFGRELKDTGIEGVFSYAEGLAAETYKFYKGGLFRSDKTKRSDLDAEIASPLNKAFHDVGKSVKDMVEVIGGSADALGAFEFDFKFSTKGMDEEEIQKELEDQLERYGNEAALAVLPRLKQFLEIGETAYDGLTRLSESLSAANAGFEKLGHTLYATSLAGADMASELAKNFGGISEMTSAMDNYFELFYSADEKRAALERSVRQQLGTIGMTLPVTREAYRDMVDSLDLTTESGREAYAMLVGMASAIDQLIPLVDGLTQEILDMMGAVQTAVTAQMEYANSMIQIHEQLANDWYEAAKEIRSVIRDLKYDKNTSQNTLAYSRAQYSDTYNRALGGDVEAAQLVGEYAKAYQEQLLANSTSGADYDKAIAKLMSELTLVAGSSDLEGARHDALVNLYETQIEVLESIEALLQARTMSPEDIATLPQEMQDALANFDGTLGDLDSSLVSIAGAIKEVSQMSFKDIMKDLNVTIKSIDTSNLPAEVKALLTGAAQGIKAQVDFILRSDLPPDMKFLAITQQSQHLKTIKFLAVNNIGTELTRLALSNVANLQRNLVLTMTSNMTDADRRLLLAANSTLARNINVLLASTSDPDAIRLGLLQNRTQILRVRATIAEDVDPNLRRLLLSRMGLDGTITLGANFTFDPSTAFRVWYGAQTQALISPMNTLRSAIADLRAAVAAETRRAEMEAERERRLAALAARKSVLDNAITRAQNNIDSIGAKIKALPKNGAEQAASIQRTIMSATATGNASSKAEGFQTALNAAKALGINVSSLNGAAGTDASLRALSALVSTWAGNQSSSTSATATSLQAQLTAAQAVLTGLRDQLAAVNSNIKTLSTSDTIPGFATGGAHGGGLRVVGEQGPEVEATGPSRVYSATRTMDMLGDSDTVAELQLLRSEVVAMRTENNQGQAQVAKQSRKTADMLTRWDIDGQPDLRDAS